MDRRRFLQLTLLGTSLGTIEPLHAARTQRIDYRSLHGEVLKHQGSAWAISKAGKIVGGANLEARSHTFSITKVICALLVSKALSNGWLTLEERVAQTFPEWAKTPGKDRIALLQLLQQTSGLESGSKALYTNAPKDKSAAARALKCVNSPGTGFRYGPASWELLAAILDEKLRRRGSSLLAFLHSELLSPVGLSGARWRQDTLGVPYLSTGAFFSNQEMQRFGTCILKLLKGQNTQGFKSKAFLACISPSEANPMFGGGLWRSSLRGTGVIDVEQALKRDTTFPWPNGLIAPPPIQDLYAMIGSGGKRIFLLPQQEIVLTRHGSGENWWDSQFFQNSKVRTLLTT